MVSTDNKMVKEQSISNTFTPRAILAIEKGQS